MTEGSDYDYLFKVRLQSPMRHVSWCLIHPFPDSAYW